MSDPYTLTSKSDGAISYTSTDSEVATLSESAVNEVSKTFYVKAGTKTGTATIKIKQEAAGEYRAAETSFIVTVTGSKQETTITIDNQPEGGFQVDTTGDGSTAPLKFTTNDTTATPTVSVTQHTNNGLAVSTPTATEMSGQYESTLTGSAYEEDAQVTITVPVSESYTGATKVVDVKVNRVTPELSGEPEETVTLKVGDSKTMTATTATTNPVLEIDASITEQENVTLTKGTQEGDTLTYTLEAISAPTPGGAEPVIQVTVSTPETLVYASKEYTYSVSVQGEAASGSLFREVNGTNTLFHPVFDGTLSKDEITFYDSDDNPIGGTGEGDNYQMSDLTGATRYEKYSELSSAVYCYVVVDGLIWTDVFNVDNNDIYLSGGFVSNYLNDPANDVYTVYCPDRTTSTACTGAGLGAYNWLSMTSGTPYLNTNVSYKTFAQTYGYDGTSGPKIWGVGLASSTASKPYYYFSASTTCKWGADLSFTSNQKSVILGFKL